MKNEHEISPALGDWARRSIRQIQMRVSGLAPAVRKRKLAVVHLDGVPKALLEASLAEGRMPFLRSLVQSGRYRLDRAFWGSPSSTASFLAGVLYGLRHPNLPAYHWYDRELGRAVHMNAPRDAAAIDARLSSQAGRGSLLGGGGTSYLSLFRGGAANELCMASLTQFFASGMALLKDLPGLVGVPRREGAAGLLKELVRSTSEAAVDLAQWCVETGEVRHEPEFLKNRFLLLTLAWRVAHTGALIDMVRGVPSLYLVFTNFDEVAHRRGPWSAQARAELDRVDADLAEMYAVARNLAEPYDVVFLTDHGHVPTMPFEQRTGTTLAGFLAQAGGPALPSDVQDALLSGRAAPAQRPGEVPLVVEAGNFAHVYLTRSEQPLEAREILARHSALLARVVGSREIGLAVLRRGASAVALCDGCAYSPEALSNLPEGYSKDAVADLLGELPRMPTAGDLVIYGRPKGQGTIAFSWEFGSHGGVTPAETESTILWPKDAPVSLSGLGHSAELHQRLMEGYRR